MVNPLANRPLVRFVLAFAAGIIACAFFALFRQIWLMMGLSLISIIVLLFGRKTKLGNIIGSCILAFALGLGITFMYSNSMRVNQIPETASVSARVCSLPRENGTGMSMDLRDCVINGQSISKKVRLYIDAPLDINYNDTIQITDAQLRIPQPQRNPEGMNARRNAWGKGIVLQVTAKQETISAQKGKTNLFSLIYAWRFRMEEALRRNMTPQSFGAIKGMLFGDTSEMDEEWMNAFSVTGIMHVLAVSGQHVSIIAGALAVCFDLLQKKMSNQQENQYKRKRRIRLLKSVIITAVLIMYCIMAGLGASVIRATIMGVLLLWGDWFGERSDTLTSLAASAFILLIWNPFQLFQAGFILSYAAVLGICIFYPPLKRKIDPLKKRHLWLGTIVDLLAISFAAQFGVLPAQLVLFGTLPTISMLVNLLITPFVTISAITGFLAALLGSIWFGLGLPFALVTEGCMRAIEWVVLPASRIPFATIVVGTPKLWGGIAILAGMLALSKWTIKKRLRMIFIGCAVAVIAIGIPLTKQYEKRTMDVVFLDVGQGDAIYIRQGDTHILFDGGNQFDSYDNGAQVILPFLYHQGVSSLDAIIASHPDQDHTGGLASVAQALPVKLFISGPDDSKPENTALNIMDIVQEKDIPHKKLMAGDSFSIGQATAKVLAPTSAKTEGNDASLVIQVDYGETTILFTGDAEFSTEDAIMKELRPIDILKVGHHGSKNATSTAFLNVLQPQYAILSVGANNRYGHPSNEVMERLNQASITSLRTDKNGAISIHIDDKTFSITTCKGGNYS